MDALLIVVRDFANPSVVHIDDNINPDRDIQNLLTELVFSDLEILMRRITRLQAGLKGAKPSENLNPSRHGNNYCGSGEVSTCVGIHTYSEYMMGPDYKT